MKDLKAAAIMFSLTLAASIAAMYLWEKRNERKLQKATESILAAAAPVEE